MVFIDDLAAEFHGARVKLIGSENGFESSVLPEPSIPAIPRTSPL